jgi:uncharacterized protein involved in exopolysaccharide biosynthesis
VQLASYAAVPERAVLPMRAVNTVVAAALGFLAAFLAVAMSVWWQKDDNGDHPES